jgi:hypothetical protein
MPAVDKNRIISIAEISRDTLKEMGEDYKDYKRAKACCTFIEDSRKRDLLDSFEELYEEHSEQIVNGKQWLDEDVVLKFGKNKVIPLGKVYKHLENQSNSVLAGKEDAQKRDKFLIDLYTIFSSLAETKDEKNKIDAFLKKLSGEETTAPIQATQSSQQSQNAQQKDPVNFIQNMVGKMAQNENGIEGFLNNAMSNPKIQQIKEQAENNQNLKNAFEKGDFTNIVTQVFSDPNMTNSFRDLMSDTGFFQEILTSVDPERKQDTSTNEQSSQEYSE